VILENALVKLVKEIWCEGLEDVAVREIAPEWCVDWSETEFIVVGFGFGGRRRISEARLMFPQQVQCFDLLARGRCAMTSPIFWFDLALRAAIFHAVCDQSLLGIIGNISRVEGDPAEASTSRPSRTADRTKLKNAIANDIAVKDTSAKKRWRKTGPKTAAQSKGKGKAREDENTDPEDDDFLGSGSDGEACDEDSDSSIEILNSEVSFTAFWRLLDAHGSRFGEP
jgi:hypothetical protein